MFKGKKKNQIKKETLISKSDKDLQSLHSKKEIAKRKVKKTLRLTGDLYVDNTIELDINKNITSRKEKRLQEINDKHQMKAVNKSNKTPKGSRNLKNLSGNIIDIKNVKKIYTTKTLRFVALQKTSLSITKGDFVVILGPSGSGKTTLLNIISGLDRATEGDVVVSGTNLSALTDHELTNFRRENVGFIFQSYNLLSSLNVSDNVEIGSALQKDKTKRKKTADLLNLLDIENTAKKNTYELSGGQQQRVSIARALAKSPNILIGDEPTGALDSVTTARVLQLFQEINKETKTTVILVTHNPKIAELGNKVIFVKDGVVESIKSQKPKKASDFKEI